MSDMQPYLAVVQVPLEMLIERWARLWVRNHPSQVDEIPVQVVHCLLLAWLLREQDGHRTTERLEVLGVLAELEHYGPGHSALAPKTKVRWL
ncbi:hypothetical protein LCGC14_2159610 [marine sediment metagenome]|uniref:Uncharacterized protein n=1 Tax=marine sediment metagenome TaxID=412755 RepID=A0A0F9GPA3_9ZZZZ